ncbi:hypothetical protein NGA_0727900 [Nannochloropsis gaditana CCMP526]|uniref:uncharacterized protein n=1 Tax=Nannochloropsis gaditana (strain CCMP526) TaxID=1093141 RepID=UPI00029F79DD|nr:hypothetical protein NGA_0727900 [Nannochloropsis gaditana CCMP526]EKU23445.1 hypothetical protein NGA_0727900 [Nannochloropsis gaditana CCMP526]|eukprot:XP_005852387.1 hypothetical protein NGA_0727900 [Nannochloropsis gaditana CCMP526]
MPSGKWREREGFGHIAGGSQWHIVHWTLLYEVVVDPQVQKLLLSLKTTGIPDESFFPTAGLWLQEKAQAREKGLRLRILNLDLRYSNESHRRDLSYPGERAKLKHLGQTKNKLWARKALTAKVTCEYTNDFLRLHHDCAPYEGMQPIIDVE